MAADARVDEHRHGRVLELVINNTAQRNALEPQIIFALTTRAAPRDARLERRGAAARRRQHFAPAAISVAGAARWAAAHRDPERIDMHRLARTISGSAAGDRRGRGTPRVRLLVALGCDLSSRPEPYTLSYVRLGVNPTGGNGLVARALPPQLASELAMRRGGRRARRQRTRRQSLVAAGRAGTSPAVHRNHEGRRAHRPAKRRCTNPRARSCAHLEREREFFAESFHSAKARRRCRVLESARRGSRLGLIPRRPQAARHDRGAP